MSDDIPDVAVATARRIANAHRLCEWEEVSGPIVSQAAKRVDALLR